MAKKLSASSPREKLKRVSLEDIKNRTWTKHELAVIDRIGSSQACGAEEPAATDEIPALSDEQLQNLIRLRDVRKRVAVSVRLDPRVLEWLRSKGSGHLTRINDILTNLMEAELRTKAG